MRTPCPLMKQENVIKNVQKAAQQFQNYRKSFAIQSNSAKQTKEEKAYGSQSNSVNSS